MRNVFTAVKLLTLSLCASSFAIGQDPDSWEKIDITIREGYVASDAPSLVPSSAPSDAPSLVPSDAPSLVPSTFPSDPPSTTTSDVPSVVPVAADLPTVLSTAVPTPLADDGSDGSVAAIEGSSSTSTSVVVSALVTGAAYMFLL